MARKNSTKLKAEEPADDDTETVNPVTGEVTVPSAVAAEKKLTRYDQIRAVQKHIDELDTMLSDQKDEVKKTRGILKDQKNFLYKLIHDDPLEELDFDGKK